MIGDVPDDTGAVHDTVIAAAPGVVVSPVGAPGGAGVGCGVATADGSDGTLDPEIEGYAEGLAQLSPASIAQAKATIEALTAGRADPDIAAGFEALFVGPDFAEGRAAFLGRRPPRF